MKKEKIDSEGEWRHFLEFCLKLKTRDNFKEFFDLLFTLDEKEDLIKRARVITALLRGDQTQREIAKEINVSIFKVTRGSNALKIISNHLKTFLKKEFI